VTLPDGRTDRTASQIRRDPQSGLALLVIDPKDLHAASWSEGAPELGDPVAAVGRPPGSDGLVSTGVVSALGSGTDGALSTDALASPGAAVVDAEGRVVGLAVPPPGPPGMGLLPSGPRGFVRVIPASLARRIAGDLAGPGVVKRAFLGVSLNVPDRATAERLGGGGALVDGVLEGSPAAKAGLKAGDVILRLDGKPVASPLELQAAVERATVGEPLTLTVARDGRREEVKVTPEARPDRVEAQPVDEGAARRGDRPGAEPDKGTSKDR